MRLRRPVPLPALLYRHTDIRLCCVAGSARTHRRAPRGVPGLRPAGGLGGCPRCRALLTGGVGALLRAPAPLSGAWGLCPDSRAGGGDGLLCREPSDGAGCAPAHRESSEVCRASARPVPAVPGGLRMLPRAWFPLAGVPASPGPSPTPWGDPAATALRAVASSAGRAGCSTRTGPARDGLDLAVPISCAGLGQPQPRRGYLLCPPGRRRRLRRGVRGGAPTRPACQPRWSTPPTPGGVGGIPTHGRQAVGGVRGEGCGRAEPPGSGYGRAALAQGSGRGYDEGPGSYEPGPSGCGWGRGRTGDLSLFRRSLVPTELPSHETLPSLSGPDGI